MAGKMGARCPPDETSVLPNVLWYDSLMAMTRNRRLRLKDVERATDEIVAHRFPWCRARLLHALVGADEQGVLKDVLDELGVDADKVRAYFKDNGWTRRRRCRR